MDAIDFLASNNYIIVNRSLMMAIGVNESLVLGELASEYRYWKEAGKLKDGEWFFSTDNNLMDRLPFSRPTIQRVIAKLKEFGIIETKLMGVPAKRFFRIHPERISGVSNFIQLDDKNLIHHKNKEEEYIRQKDSSDRSGEQVSHSEPGVRMKPSALRQELARIFKSSDPSKTKSTQSVARLQECIDDDQLILKAARKMKAQPPIEINGRMWKPDYFWFVNPDKTDTVARRIIEAVKDDLIEEEIPEGLREQYDVAITLGEAQDYNECRENWGKILPKIKFTDEYRRLTDGR